MTQHTNEWGDEREDLGTANSFAQAGESGSSATPEEDDARASDERNDTPPIKASRKPAHTSSKRATNRNRKRINGADGDAAEGFIISLPVRNQQRAEPSDDALVVAELEAQGFTEDEALRLIHVSDRVATSKEARDAEATLRRLRFTRWLVERGVLDEFTA